MPGISESIESGSVLPTELEKDCRSERDPRETTTIVKHLAKIESEQTYLL